MVFLCKNLFTASTPVQSSLINHMKSSEVVMLIQYYLRWCTCCIRCACFRFACSTSLCLRSPPWSGGWAHVVQARTIRRSSRPEIRNLIKNKLIWVWRSLVRGDKGFLYGSNSQKNLVIVYHELSLLFWLFKNSTAYYLGGNEPLGTFD